MRRFLCHRYGPKQSDMPPLGICWNSRPYLHGAPLFVLRPAILLAAPRLGRGQMELSRLEEPNLNFLSCLLHTLFLLCCLNLASTRFRLTSGLCSQFRSAIQPLRPSGIRRAYAGAWLGCTLIGLRGSSFCAGHWHRFNKTRFRP